MSANQWYVKCVNNYKNNFFVPKGHTPCAQQVHQSQDYGQEGARPNANPSVHRCEDLSANGGWWMSVLMEILETFMWVP